MYSFAITFTIYLAFGLLCLIVGYWLGTNSYVRGKISSVMFSILPTLTHSPLSQQKQVPEAETSRLERHFPRSILPSIDQQTAHRRQQRLEYGSDYLEWGNTPRLKDDAELHQAQQLLAAKANSKQTTAPFYSQCLGTPTQTISVPALKSYGLGSSTRVQVVERLTEHRLDDRCIPLSTMTSAKYILRDSSNDATNT